MLYKVHIIEQLTTASAKLFHADSDDDARTLAESDTWTESTGWSVEHTSVQSYVDWIEEVEDK